MLLVEEIERTYRPQAMEKGLELYLEIDPELGGELMLDPLRVRQVLVNLVSNALKFTTEGSITLEVWRGEMDGVPVITFGVEDTGIGIRPKQARCLFDPFIQADRSTSREFGGTGLGLAISKRLVEGMGGTIAIEQVLI